MELRELIEMGANKAGDQRNLAKVLGLAPNNVTEAKAGRRGLPAEACGKLADLIGVDRWIVLAASNLVTERNEEKRAYWLSVVERKAAAWFCAAIGCGLLMAGTPSATYASDTLFVSPSGKIRINTGVPGRHYPLNTDYE